MIKGGAFIMATYKIIAANTKHFKSLLKDYSETMHIVTYPINNCLAELEDDNDFVILLNGAKMPPAYL